MKLLCLSFVLALASPWQVAVPTPLSPMAVVLPEDCVPIPDIVFAVPFSGDQLLCFHADRTTTLVPLASLRVPGGEGGCVNLPGAVESNLPQVGAFGWPMLATAAGPHVYETTYVSASGTHTVRTPCSAYNTTLECARAHARALADLQTVFPRV